MKIDQQRSILFGKPDITRHEIEAVKRVMASGWLSTGPYVKKFEEMFAQYMGNSVRAIAVSSCTDAITLSLMAMEIGPGDKVILPTMTFCATVNAIIQTGATPVFVDSSTTGHINPFIIEEQLDDDVRAIIPVHYTGSACNMSEIMRIAYDHRLRVIEDAAHGFDGYGIGEDRFPSVLYPIGTMGHCGCFSFYATKNITCGEGGMVITKDPVLAEGIRVISRQGQTDDAWGCTDIKASKERQVLYPGRKSNMTDIQAAIGIVQLMRWHKMREKRSRIWKVYEKAFGKKAPGHSMHIYTIQVKERDSLRKFLYKNGISTGVHFRPLHLEPGYEFLGYKQGDFPVAEYIGKTTVSLPISSSMSVSDAEFVVKKINEFEGKRK